MSQRAKAIVWVEGVPQPANSVAPISKSTMASLLGSALSLEYIASENDRELYGDRFIGVSNAEAAMIKLSMLAASGDFDATKEIMDRTMGKAKQEVHSTTVSFTYQDYLQQLVDQEAKALGETKQLVEYAEVIEEKRSAVEAEEEDFY